MPSSTNITIGNIHQNLDMNFKMLLFSSPSSALIKTAELLNDINCMIRIIMMTAIRINVSTIFSYTKSNLVFNA